MANVQSHYDTRPGGTFVWYSDTNPATLTYFGPGNAGDFCQNIGSSGPVGWICTTAGNPGQWIEAISANASLSVTVTATIAQINAGLTLVAGVAGRTITVTNFYMMAHGNFTTATDVRISDTASSPVDVVTVVVADFQDTNIVTPAGGTGITVGTFAAPLTAGKGLQLRKTGSSITVATSATVTVQYSLT